MPRPPSSEPWRCTPESHEALARDVERYLEETRHAGFVADEHCVIELRVHGRCRATLRRVIYDNRKKLQVGWPPGG